MKIIQKLEEIAEEKNWIAFAKKLRAAMLSYEDFGVGNKGEVLSKVAALQGKSPASLQNPLSAEKWIADYAPDEYPRKSREISMTNVLLLKQIHSLSANAAAIYSPRVFASEIGRNELKQALEAVKKAEGVQGTVGHERWQRAHNFTRLAEEYISKNLPRLFDWPNAVAKSRNKQAPLPCDLEIWSDGVPVVAVELKVARQKSTRSNRAETLGLASLLSNEFHEVLLIYSHGPSRPLREIVQLRDELNLHKVRIATLDESLCRTDPKKALRFW
ncbi:MULTISPECIES: hypothetical protein [unclassified Marinovum]